MFYPPERGVQPERQVGQVANALDALKLELATAQAEELENPADIVAAVLENEILAARTVLEQGPYTATLFYPVKTINANQRDNIYQTDTGPILWPDLSKQPGELIAGFELAFSAFNCPTWIEFIVRAKTPLTKDISVYHYSRTFRADSRNTLMRLTGPLL